jgi:hypothetical protein
MSAIALAPVFGPADRADRVSLPRLVWVAPLTLVAAVAACFGVRSGVLLLDPSLARMPQLQMPMVTLAAEGAVAAIVVFTLFALFVPRPNFWYRILGAVALVASWIPDVALALGGTPMRLALQVVGPSIALGGGLLSSLGAAPVPSGPPPGAQTGGPPPGFMSSMPIEQVLVLMLLHAVVACVCIALLTTLTRGPRLARA